MNSNYEALLEAERILTQAFNDAHSTKLERETGIVVPQSARSIVCSAKHYITAQVRDEFAGR